MKPLRLLLLLPLWLACLSLPAAESRPNIVILYADDMGYGDLGAQNPDSKIPTPHLDKLASQGMRFTDAHSSSGICTPSRYALLTGRFHWRKMHGIVNSFDKPVLDEADTTLPELLKTQGYRTACIGKWHLGWNWDDILKPGAEPVMDARGRHRVFASGDFDWGKPVSGGPLSHGFDYYFGDDVPNFPPYAWFENDRVITVPSEPLTITPETREGNWEARPGPMTPGWDFYAVVPRLRDQAVKWIGQQKGKEGPFFLYVPFNSPHAPIVPTNEFTGKSQAGGYGDFMVQTDAKAGQILQALEANGFADNTLVIFSADNGAEHYAYPRIQNFGHRSSGPLRGVKRDLHEGGHRLPFVVRWPGVVKPGTVSDALTSQVDILATVAAIIGAEIPAGSANDSYNQLPVWKENAPSPRTTIVHNTKEDAYALRHQNWLLVAAKSGAQSKVPAWYNEEFGYAKNEHEGELYDLSTDLAQKHNLYAEKPDKVKELTGLLEQVRSKGQVR
ncbi:arylsulfatase [Prosthecobacter sp. SYSU 5D2]|uniref:sulfatase family protein n=1 Tax=Prosthecobacter sp. SYSU 5D2 TaxID=3134134 RepID=UPI0031FE4504